MRRRLIPLLVVVIVVAVVAWWLRRPGPTTVELTGTVDGNEITVGSKITGRIVTMPVQDGEQVQAGQLLATLDQAELKADDEAATAAINQAQASTRESQTQAQLLAATLAAKVQQAQAQVAQAEAQQTEAQAQVKAAVAAVDKATDNLTRITPLARAGVNSPQDLVNAQTDRASAVANLDAAQAALQAAQRSVAAARAGLEDAQQQQRQVEVQREQTASDEAAENQALANRAAAIARFDQTEVRSPIAGVITLRAARVGEVVSPGAPIVTIFDLSDTWVDADVPETYANLVTLGEVVPVRLPSGAIIHGPIIYKATEADWATQRDVSRTKRDIKTFEIRLRCDNRDRSLAVGMTAYVTLPLTGGK